LAPEAIANAIVKGSATTPDNDAGNDIGQPVLSREQTGAMGFEQSGLG